MPAGGGPAPDGRPTGRDDTVPDAPFQRAYDGKPSIRLSMRGMKFASVSSPSPAGRFRSCFLPTQHGPPTVPPRSPRLVCDGRTIEVRRRRPASPHDPPFRPHRRLRSRQKRARPVNRATAGGGRQLAPPGHGERLSHFIPRRFSRWAKALVMRALTTASP